MNFPHGRLAMQDRFTGERKAVTLDILLAQLSMQQMALQAGGARKSADETIGPLSERMRYFAGRRRNDGMRRVRESVPSGNFSPALANMLKELPERPLILSSDGESEINPDNSAIVKNVKLHPLLDEGSIAATAHRGQI